MESTKLGAFLRLMRKRHNLSQEELASQLGLRRQSYSHYETGRNTPPLDILVHLAEIYHISVEAFTKLSDKLSESHPDIILDDDGGYLVYNSSLEAIKYISLSDEESDLINHFRLLDERDRSDILEFTKLKVRLREDNKL